MKKIIILIFVFLNILILAMAKGDTLNLDFEENREYRVWMDQGDRVAFEWGGYKHTIIVDEIKGKTVSLDVFLYLDGWQHSPNYVYLNDNNFIQLDFDKDTNKDLKIDLISNELDDEKVLISFKVLEGADPSLPIDFEGIYLGKVKTESINLYYVYIIGGVILALLLVTFLVGKLTKKDTYF